MTRLAWVLSLNAVLACGCVSLDGLAPGLNGTPIRTPDAKTVSVDSLKLAERVQTLGQRIIEQNTFTGLQPLFHTLGMAEPVLFHRGPDELFISEGLVRRCETETDLAVVLCSELGRMMAEKRAARRLGVELESVRETGEDETLAKGTIASAAVSVPEKEPVPVGPRPDAPKLACELLQGAGFDPAEWERRNALLQGVKSHDTLGRQIAGPAAAPRWQH